MVWVIPQDDLPAIARRNGWTIDLREGAEELLSRDPEAEHVSQEDITGETATHPDLEGWDTSRWNQAIGIVSDGHSPDEDGTSLEARNLETGSVEETPGETVEVEASVETPASAAKDSTDAKDTVATPSPDAPSETSIEPVVGSDRDSAIEVSIASTAPIPTTAEVTPTAGGPEAVQSMVEALDLALLERLLEAQEGRVSAEVVSQENKHALAALNVNHNRATAELEVERRERMMASDRYREERMARAVSDAKVAELRDRLVREMALADTEKAARTEALTRSVKAERDAANAVAAMGWRARRRYRKLNAAMADQVVENQQGQSQG